jgi:hypothetical protein
MPGIPKRVAIVLLGLLLLLIPAALFSQKIPIAVLDFEANGFNQIQQLKSPLHDNRSV